MSINESYNTWANTYDAVENKTRDLEAVVLRESFRNPHYGNIVELGCGTGKNTSWLANKADHVKALDFSSEMLNRAQAKIDAENVTFSQTDITQDWPVRSGWANLITCSLVLEHVKNLDFIFKEASRVLKRCGNFYICELHPYRQYQGKQARFETEKGHHTLEAYVHHITDYLSSAKKTGFHLSDINEYFDDPSRIGSPRLISLVFQND